MTAETERASLLASMEQRLELGLRDVTMYDDDEQMLFEAYRALSGGAPARPTREALIAAISAHEFGPYIEAAKARDDHGSAAIDGVANLADALLAADHLWTEAPSESVDSSLLAEVGRELEGLLDSLDDHVITDDDERGNVYESIRRVWRISCGEVVL